MNYKIHNNLKHLSYHFILVAVMICSGAIAKAQTLEDLKIIAAENNLKLKSQYKLFESKLEVVTQAKAWQDPNLSFGYFISPIETRVGPQIARFSLSQKLPWFGTYKVKGDIAAYLAEAEFERFQDQKFKLFLDVAEKYYDLSALRYTKQLEIEHLEILENLKSIVKSNYENNRADLVDILRVELEINKQANALKVLSDQDKALVTQLNQVLNQPLKTPVEIQNPEQILRKNEFMKFDTVDNNHPRLEAIRLMEKSNSAKKDLAKKEAMPQFGFGLDYAIIQDRNVMNADAGQDALMPMVSISLPIFGKKNRARKKEAALLGEAIALQLEDEKVSLNSEIQVANYKRDEIYSLLNLYEKQLLNLEDILKLSETALANASMGIEEVLRLQEERLLYEKQNSKALANLQKINETLSYLTSNSEL